MSGQLLSALPLPTSPSTGGPEGYFSCIMILAVIFSPLHPHYVAHIHVILLTLLVCLPPCNRPVTTRVGAVPACPSPAYFSSVQAGWLAWLQVNTQSVLNPTPRPLSPAHSHISSHTCNVICTISSRHHPRRGSFCPSPAYPLSPARYEDWCMLHMIFNCIQYTAYSIQPNYSVHV